MREIDEVVALAKSWAVDVVKVLDLQVLGDVTQGIFRAYAFGQIECRHVGLDENHVTQQAAAAQRKSAVAGPHLAGQGDTFHGCRFSGVAANAGKSIYKTIILATVAHNRVPVIPF